MTDQELAAVVRGIVPLVREAVTKALADASTRIAVLEAQVKAIGDLRDKVVTIEAKALAPAPEPVPVDLAPVLERVAAAEARLASIGDLRDRVVTIETKAALPLPAPPAPPTVDLSPVLERLASADSRLARLAGLETIVTELRDRVVTMEAKAAPDLSGLDTRVGSVEAAKELTTKELARLSERIAVVETRAPTPGPPGQDGAKGIDGTNGKDGADGLGFDDLTVDFDGDRTILLVFERGSQKKTFPISLPFLKYEGNYQEGRTYVKGDVITYAGHMWYCEDSDTTAKPNASKAWKQCVQRGKDGPPGRDGRDLLPLPVLKVGGAV